MEGRGTTSIESEWLLGPPPPSVGIAASVGAWPCPPLTLYAASTVAAMVGSPGRKTETVEGRDQGEPDTDKCPGR